jgi:hypothetical protein
MTRRMILSFLKTPMATSSVRSTLASVDSYQGGDLGSRFSHYGKKRLVSSIFSLRRIVGIAQQWIPLENHNICSLPRQPLAP